MKAFKAAFFYFFLMPSFIPQLALAAPSCKVQVSDAVDGKTLNLSDLSFATTTENISDLPETHARTTVDGLSIDVQYSGSPKQHWYDVNVTLPSTPGQAVQTIYSQSIGGFRQGFTLGDMHSVVIICN